MGGLQGEYAHLSKREERESQSAHLYGHRTNGASYRTWRAWLRETNALILVARSANDPSCTAPGGQAFARETYWTRKFICCMRAPGA